MKNLFMIHLRIDRYNENSDFKRLFHGIFVVVRCPSQLMLCLEPYLQVTAIATV
jgi:hypothetical protein